MFLLRADPAGLKILSARVLPELPADWVAADEPGQVWLLSGVDRGQPSVVSFDLIPEAGTGPEGTPQALLDRWQNKLQLLLDVDGQPVALR